MRKNSITDFVEEQEILNNIQTSIKKLYSDDEALRDEEFLKELTVRTLEVINYMDTVHDGLLEESGIIQVAKQYSTSTEQIARDIIEVMLFSTIARQSMELEKIGC